jgi:DNA-binding HxlR family transcriptional regulator
VPRHGYDQYCPVAVALDVVGDRWSLLLVRELLLGPRRFGDLLASLPGLGTSLLSARLKQLEDDGVLERDRLGPPANVPVYRLTEHGSGLGPVIAALGRWGSPRLAGTPVDSTVRPELLGLLLAARSPTEEAAGCYRFDVDGTSAFHLRVHPDGQFEVRIGEPATPADATVRITVSALAELVLSGVPVAELEAKGQLEIDAAPAMAARVRSLLVP